MKERKEERKKKERKSDRKTERFENLQMERKEEKGRLIK